jgi:hypothetical protein
MPALLESGCGISRGVINMALRKKEHDSDVLFMHADDEATIRHKYTAAELRESLLLHILFCGRVLIPLPFLLDNPMLSNLFKFRDEISARSDIYRLITSGDIVPVIHGDFGSIRDYAKAMIDRKFLMHCTNEEFLQRAELLNEFSYLTPSAVNSEEKYKEIYLGLLKNRNIWAEYFGSNSNRSNTIVESVSSKLMTSDHISRSVIYQIAEQARVQKTKLALKLLADAAYYANFADTFNVNPAVPSSSAIAIISYYSGANGPMLFSPGEERILGTDLPDLSGMSIADVIGDLRENSLRTDWLKTLNGGMKKGYIDLSSREVYSSMEAWSAFLTSYLSAEGVQQRKDIVAKQRRFSLFTHGLRIGEQMLSVAGVVISAADVMQGGFTIGAVSLFAGVTGTDLALRFVRAHAQKLRPVRGSAVPLSRTFTVRGQRYS